MKHTKLLTIGGLPLMWFLYFLFEVLTGRVTNIDTVLINIMLIVLFSVVGYVIFKFSIKFKDGLSIKVLIYSFIFILLIDQGIKIVIKNFFFNLNFDILKDMLSFNPLINTDGSWLNARFGTSVSFPLLIIINALALIIIFELFRYFSFKNIKNFWSDCSFLFLLCGALCSLIDKVFYGGSLDFIGISNLFVADIKDIYINLGLYFFIIGTYSCGYLTSEDDSNLKEDLDSLKRFLEFIKQDILYLFKKK